MQLRKFLIKIFVLTIMTLIFSKPLTVEAGQRSIMVDIEKDGRSEQSYQNVFYDLILLRTNVVKKETDLINEILTDRIDVCKVGKDVSSTVDSITSVTEVLIAEKEMKEIELAEKEMKEVELTLSQLSIDNGFVLDEEALERASNFKDISEDDIYLLAAIIHCEARGESYEGQVAVGAVVLNRMMSKDFPDNIKDIIYESRQFSPVSSGAFDRVLLSGEINSSCISAAQDALNGVNPIGNCLYFSSVKSASGLKIGNHIFK